MRRIREGAGGLGVIGGTAIGVGLAAGVGVGIAAGAGAFGGGGKQQTKAFRQGLITRPRRVT